MLLHGPTYYHRGNRKQFSFVSVRRLILVWCLSSINNRTQFRMDEFLPLTTWFWLGELNWLLICPKFTCENTLQNEVKMKVLQKLFLLLCSYKSLFTDTITVPGTRNSHPCLCHCRLLIHTIKNYIRQPSWKSELKNNKPAW